jgi:hypothetical protein
MTRAVEDRPRVNGFIRSSSAPEKDYPKRTTISKSVARLEHREGDGRGLGGD